MAPTAKAASLSMEKTAVALDNLLELDTSGLNEHFVVLFNRLEV